MRFHRFILFLLQLGGNFGDILAAPGAGQFKRPFDN